jgi:hypothetical protein
MQVFMGVAILLIILPLVIIFYARPQVWKEVWTPTSLLPKIVELGSGFGAGLCGFLGLFHARLFRVDLVDLSLIFGFLFLCYFWVYTIYLLCHSVGGKRNKPTSNDQPQSPSLSDPTGG